MKVPVEDLMKELELFEKQNVFSREQVKIVLEKFMEIQDEKVKKLKESISHEIQMGIESGYIDEELWYPHKDLCHDPFDKVFAKQDGGEDRE